LVIGLAAAIAVWAFIQSVHPLFHVSKEYDVPSIGMPTEKFLAHQKQRDLIDQKHAALYLGALGVLLTVASGSTHGMVAGWWWKIAVAAGLAAAGGVIGGVLGCSILQDVRTNIGQADLLHLVESQLAVAAPLGLGVGLGIALWSQTISLGVKTTLAGLAGGLLAAVAYPVIVSILLPDLSTDVLLPDTAIARLVWLCLLSGLIGLAIPIAERQRGTAIPNTEPPAAATA
jgi:hypothetical protein